MDYNNNEEEDEEEYHPNQQQEDIELKADEEVDYEEIEDLLAENDINKTCDTNHDINNDDNDYIELDDINNDTDPEDDYDNNIDDNTDSDNNIEQQIQEIEEEVLEDIEEGKELLENVRRSTRSKHPVERLTYSQIIESQQRDSYNNELELKHNLFTQALQDEGVLYDDYDAMILGYLMESAVNAWPTENVFAQQYSIEKGLKKYGEEGYTATYKAAEQLHDSVCFQPISISKLTNSERKKAQLALTFLTEKRDKSIKARTCYNGKPTREWLTKQDAASPTVSIESLILTAMIDTHENRDVMSADVPNAFIQTELPREDSDERIIMKIQGSLVDILISISPSTYKDYVVYEKGKKTLYVELLKALYGMLIVALLFYRQFKKDLEEIGFIFNPYDMCVAN